MITKVVFNNFFYKAYTEKGIISPSPQYNYNNIDVKNIDNEELKNLEEILQKLNQELNKNFSLRFKKDVYIDRILIEIYDKTSGKIVKMIPPEEIVDFMRNLKKLKLVDEEV